MSRGRRALVSTLFSALVSCGGTDEEAQCVATNDNGTALTTPTGAPTFVAFAAHFQGYQKWTSMPATMNPEFSTPLTGTVHDLGPMTVYINRMPPAGAKAFPVGTVIVKEANTGALGERTVFGMVKRGGGFNSTGATDWEWFELVNACDGVQILWRGVGPPDGEKYGGDAASGCNACHAVGKGNDFALTKGLRLLP